MKKSKFTGEQIAFALRKAEVGTPVAEVIRRMGPSVGLPNATLAKRRKTPTNSIGREIVAFLGSCARCAGNRRPSSARTDAETMISIECQRLARMLRYSRPGVRTVKWPAATSIPQYTAGVRLMMHFNQPASGRE